MTDKLPNRYAVVTAPEMIHLRSTIRHAIAIAISLATIVPLHAEGTHPPSIAESVSIDVAPPSIADRLWLVNTRSITPWACRADLDDPKLSISRLGYNGSRCPASQDEYLSEIGKDRPVVIYVHGYRFTHCEAIERGLFVYRQTALRRCAGPVDWVVWSWPSQRTGFIATDVREKAKFSDTQGLYLSWLLREQLHRSVPTKLIGYSLGGRVVTGALHALAGGRLGGRSLPGGSIDNAAIDVGLIAPAIEQDWLSPGEYHGLATRNMHDFLLLYNQRDAVLKRYWILDKVRGAVAFGFGRLKAFTPKIDGSEIDFRARDCSRSIGITHDELDYYERACGASSEMARLIYDPVSR